MPAIFIKQFQKIIWDHYRHKGRAMPWRKTKDPYRIVVSEIMLQQTQVARVKKYYGPFVQRFPDIRSLARAGARDVVRAWIGLGYNRRALSLRRLAIEVSLKYDGTLPHRRDALEKLPGIGKATAGAIMAFAFNIPELFIETNIRRVFIHFFFPGRKKVNDDAIMKIAGKAIDAENPREWYWALMDYGAMLGIRAVKRGIRNPNVRSANYKRQSEFSGSDREVRGKILRILLSRKRVSVGFLACELKQPHKRVEKIIVGLVHDGFLLKKGKIGITLKP
jgi:A/G-specific adenine glycosylase